jgi:hypothetical protein
VEVSEKRVAVTRAEGLAQAEVAKAQAEAEAEREQRMREIEINAQRELAKLYGQAPVLVDLETLRMQHEHEARIREVEVEGYLQAFEALAPSLQVRIYGGGGQTTRVITELMSLAQGVRYLGDEVPALGRMLGDGDGDALTAFLPRLAALRPSIRQVVEDVNPRMFTGLKVADLVDRLVPVVAGREDLMTALDNIREDASFRVVGDFPVVPVLRALGIRVPKASGEFVPVSEAEEGEAPPEEAEAVEEVEEPQEAEEPEAAEELAESRPDVGAVM